MKNAEKVKTYGNFIRRWEERPPNLQKLFVLQCGILENWEVSTNQMLSNVSIVSQDNINSPVLSGAQAGSQGVELNRLNTCKSGVF